MKNLGKKARDKVTGMTGIIVGKLIYLYGCNQYGLAPECKKGETTKNTSWLDEGRVKIIGKGITKRSVKGRVPGGENIDVPTGAI